MTPQAAQSLLDAIEARATADKRAAAADRIREYIASLIDTLERAADDALRITEAAELLESTLDSEDEHPCRDLLREVEKARPVEWLPLESSGLTEDVDYLLGDGPAESVAGNYHAPLRKEWR